MANSAVPCFASIVAFYYLTPLREVQITSDTIKILIIDIHKFLHAHWLRARQLIPHSAESWNWVQKVEIECRKLKLNWLIGKNLKARQNKMAADVGVFERAKIEQKHNDSWKFYQFNESYKYINQSTRNWTFVQHKRDFTKLLKATNRGFSYGTARKEERLQAWIEVGHFSPYNCPYNWIRIKAPDNAWHRDLKFPSVIWILKSPATPLCLRTNRKGKPLNTFCLSSTSNEIFVCVFLTSNHMIFLVQFGINQHS